MSTEFTPAVGFQPSFRQCARKRRGLAFTHLLLTFSLALSTIVALTVVTIGVARADVIGSIIADDSGAWGVALMLGSALALMGGLTAFVTRICEVRAGQ